MRLKLDENLPQELMSFLASLGHDVESVPSEKLSGANDELVLTTATGEKRTFLTFDTDFADVRKYHPGTHAGIVVFRLSDQRWDSLKGPVQRLMNSEILNRLNRGIAIVDQDRVRTRVGTDETRKK